MFDKIGPWGWTYGEPYPAELDNSHMHYLDPAYGESIVWAKKNLGMGLLKVTPVNGITKGYFYSELTPQLHGTPDPTMEAISFHFHVPTEHTFSGGYADSEMHLIHVFKGGSGDSGFLEAVNGFAHSVENYDRSISAEDTTKINDFYESLDLNQEYNAELGILPENVKFVSFMETLDYEDRYVYRGSKMKPPCQVIVSWHVTRKMYPLDKKYVYQI